MRAVVLGAVLALLCTLCLAYAVEGDHQTLNTQTKAKATQSDTKVEEHPSNDAPAAGNSGVESANEPHKHVKRSVEGLDGGLSPLGAEGGDSRQASLDRERRIRILPGFLG